MDKPLYSSYRPEIDGLRAVAVGLVIINHFNSDILPGGYLGVDIFFVISGFVITFSLAKRSRSSLKTFLTDFYSRRAKRILPALIVFVLLTSAVTSLVVESPGTFLKTGLLSIFGVSNLYLLRQSTDYFAQATEMNPFANTWSLAIEEQFYLIYPIVVWWSGFAVAKRGKTQRMALAMVVMGAASLCWYYYLYNTDISASYFSSFGRFWELAAGCLTYIVWSNKCDSKKDTNAVIAYFSIGLIISSVFLAEMNAFAATAGCVVGAAIFIYSSRSECGLGKFFASDRLVSIGLMSYSLYLWHWSILALSRWTIGIHWWTLIPQFMLIVTMSWVSFHYVETPLRQTSWWGSPQRTILRGLSIASLSAGVLFLLTRVTTPFNTFYVGGLLGIRTLGLDWGHKLECHGKEDIKRLSNPFYQCLKLDRSKSPSKRLFLIGDSHAAQLVFMAQKALVGTNYDVGFINTDSKSDFPHAMWSEKLSDETSTTQTILSNLQQDDIVAITFHKGRLNQRRDIHLSRLGVDLNDKASRTRRFLEIFADRVGRANAKMILIHDLPMLKTDNLDISVCMTQERLSGANACDVAITTDQITGWQQRMTFTDIADSYDHVYTWDPTTHFPVRNSNFYSWRAVDGSFLMADQNHITEEFSMSLAKHFRAFLEEISILTIQTRGE